MSSLSPDLDAAPLSFADIAFPNLFEKRFGVHQAPQDKIGLVAVGGFQVQVAITKNPHWQWIFDLDIIDTIKLDIIDRGREESLLDDDPLSRDSILDALRADPIDEQSDAQRYGDPEVLGDTVNDGGTAFEQELLDRGVLLHGEGLKILATISTFNGHGFDRLAAERA